MLKDMLNIYPCNVRAVLEYAAHVWQDIPTYLSDIIESFQVRALRIIFPDSSYQQAPDKVNVTSWATRRIFLCKKLMAGMRDESYPTVGSASYNKIYIISVITIHSKYFPNSDWLKPPAVIHHNQRPLTKFGNSFVIMNQWRQKFCHVEPITLKWRQKCLPLQIIEPLTEKTWGRGRDHLTLHSSACWVMEFNFSTNSFSAISLSIS